MNAYLTERPQPVSDAPLGALPDLSLGAIHPDWHTGWGATIRSKSVRRAIAENRRLSGRLADAILSAERVPAAEVDGMSAEDHQILTALSSGPQRFVERVGLVWLANEFATLVTSDALQPLLRRFEPGEIGAALKLRHLAPQADTVGYAPEKTGEMVARKGVQCILAWAEMLPPGAAGRVRLMLPRLISGDAGRRHDLERHAYRIVAAVADSFPVS
ncbi:MAG: hypothetical protein KDJ16_00380 [Hyphomicrobiales bacterium]|nr:hypothetical protein [Hyphomicrobiales bacterium]